MPGFLPDVLPIRDAAGPSFDTVALIRTFGAKRFYPNPRLARAAGFYGKDPRYKRCLGFSDECTSAVLRCLSIADL